MIPIGIPGHFQSQAGPFVTGCTVQGRGREVVPGIWIELPALTTVWTPEKTPPTMGCLGQQMETVDPSLREVVQGGSRRALLTVTKAQLSPQTY
jgi:hypothetical protein